LLRGGNATLQKNFNIKRDIPGQTTTCGDDPKGVVYFYAPGRGGENAERFLTGFDGILQPEEGQQTVRGTVCPTKGYQGYEPPDAPFPQGRRPDPRGPLLGVLVGGS